MIGKDDRLALEMQAGTAKAMSSFQRVIVPLLHLVDQERFCQQRPRHPGQPHFCQNCRESESGKCASMLGSAHTLPQHC